MAGWSGSAAQNRLAVNDQPQYGRRRCFSIQTLNMQTHAADLVEESDASQKADFPAYAAMFVLRLATPTHDKAVFLFYFIVGCVIHVYCISVIKQQKKGKL